MRSHLGEEGGGGEVYVAVKKLESAGKGDRTAPGARPHHISVYRKADSAV
jgi:hypothetical protein